LYRYTAASDLSRGLGKLTVDFDYGIPFQPFEQLLAVGAVQVVNPVDP
jgi:5'-3' exonuclease